MAARVVTKDGSAEARECGSAMGKEAQCTATYEGQRSQGRLYFGTDELTFRGSFRLSIPLKRVTGALAKDGQLVVKFPRGTAEFTLGRQAERWAEAIRSPKSLLDKLGVPSGSTVAVVGIEDDDFPIQLRDRGVTLAPRLRRGLDAVFFGAERKQDLKRLGPLVGSIKSNGAVWVVNPKGVEAVREADVLAAGKRVGLVDVKVVRFSDTHTAHKFVIPVARRRRES